MTGRRRRSDRSGRAPLFSPGRPVVAGRDQQRRYACPGWATSIVENGDAKSRASGDGAETLVTGLCPHTMRRPTASLRMLEH